MHTERLWAAVVLGALLAMWFLHRLLPSPRSMHDSVKNNVFNISTVYIIALQPVPALKEKASWVLGVTDVRVFPAVNASEAMRLAFDELPLYTKLLMEQGVRHDHMQLSSGPMLGCLLSHMSLWKQVPPGAVVAVLEEDAVLDATSTDRIRALWQDLQQTTAWDLIMLESGQATATGEWRYVGEVAATCAYRWQRPAALDDEVGLYDYYYRYYLTNNRTRGSVCTWQGSRGYLLSHRGAQMLLRCAHPMMVQVDALMGLVATFEPGFGMFWPRVDVVHKNLLHISTIWDGCLKCYMPGTSVFFLVTLVLFLTCVCGVGTYIKLA